MCYGLKFQFPFLVDLLHLTGYCTESEERIQDEAGINDISDNDNRITSDVCGAAG